MKKSSETVHRNPTAPLYIRRLRMSGMCALCSASVKRAACNPTPRGAFLPSKSICNATDLDRKHRKCSGVVHETARRSKLLQPQSCLPFLLRRHTPSKISGHAAPSLPTSSTGSAMGTASPRAAPATGISAALSRLISKTPAGSAD